jgi:hypothetical protein
LPDIEVAKVEILDEIMVLNTCTTYKKDFHLDAGPSRLSRKITDG